MTSEEFLYELMLVTRQVILNAYDPQRLGRLPNLDLKKMSVEFGIFVIEAGTWDMSTDAMGMLVGEGFIHSGWTELRLDPRVEAKVTVMA